jgi:hypothetical protein
MKPSYWAVVVVAIPLSVSACSRAARSPDAYRDDTAALLETTHEAVRTCYDDVLKRQPGAQGTVAVRFKVAEDSGRLVDVAVDPAGTTAPPPVAQCVTSHIDGLTLMPADIREGQATFVWLFKAPPAPRVASPTRDAG